MKNSVHVRFVVASSAVQNGQSTRHHHQFNYCHCSEHSLRSGCSHIHCAQVKNIFMPTYLLIYWSLVSCWLFYFMVLFNVSLKAYSSIFLSVFNTICSYTTLLVFVAVKCVLSIKCVLLHRSKRRTYCEKNAGDRDILHTNGEFLFLSSEVEHLLYIIFHSTVSYIYRMHTLQ